MLMQKEIFLELGGFDTSYKSLEDWEFVLRFAKDYQIGFAEEALVDAYLSCGGVSSATGAYYESRCRMIAEYKTEMIEAGVFDLVVSDLLRRAEGGNVLEKVKKILMIFLSNGY